MCMIAAATCQHYSMVSVAALLLAAALFGFVCACWVVLLDVEKAWQRRQLLPWCDLFSSLVCMYGDR